ncbi:hypothetical protein VKT23_004575 [Stygiomarasmius scandens]|uniref:Zn(2)-C6 fungal-type domain-containing protein n=1 Tax=Marasmiellus scandens TaxID=2682957 RepID=A0ABR1K0Y3_9AGAR
MSYEPPENGAVESMKVIPYMSAPPRTRTALACEKCRERKTKCSGEHPTCQRCKARGLICVYGIRDHKGRYQSAFAVTKSHSTSSLRSAATAMDSEPSPSSGSDSSEKRSRSVEQTIPPPDVYAQQEGGFEQYWPPQTEFLNQPMDYNVQPSSTPFQHERQWSHPSFSTPQMSSIPLQPNFDSTRHTRFPSHPLSSSHPSSIDYSNVALDEAVLMPRSQPVYPVNLNYNYPDIRGHRQGHSVSSISTGSSGSLPATPTVMNYPAPTQSTYKPDQGSTVDSSAFSNMYGYGQTEFNFNIPTASFQSAEGYDCSQDFAGHLNASIPPQMTVDEHVMMTRNSFVAHAGHVGVGSNPNPNANNQAPSSSLAGALDSDSYNYTTLQTRF